MHLKLCLLFCFCMEFAAGTLWSGDGRTQFAASTLAAFKNLFQGRYDNEMERACAVATGEPKVPTRLHCVIAHVNIRVLQNSTKSKSETFFIEQYRNNNPSDIYRRRVYHVLVEAEEKLVMKVYHLVNGSRFRNAYYKKSLLENMEQADLNYSPGCDIRWDRRQEDVFVSSMVQDKCISDWNGVPIQASDSNALTPNYMTMNFRFYNPSTRQLVGTSKFNLTRLESPGTLGNLSDIQSALVRVEMVTQSLYFPPGCMGEMNQLTYHVDAFTLPGGKAALYTSTRKFLLSPGNIQVSEPRRVAVETRIWENENAVEASLTFKLDGSTPVCVARGENITFVAGSSMGILPLGHHGDVHLAITNGDSLYFVLDFSECQRSAGNATHSWDQAIIGGRIASAGVTSDGMIHFETTPPSGSHGNGTGSAHACDEPPCSGHILSIHKNGDVTAVSWSSDPKSRVTMKCGLEGGQQPGGGLKMFSVGERGKVSMCLPGSTPSSPANGTSLCGNDILMFIFMCLLSVMTSL